MVESKPMNAGTVKIFYNEEALALLKKWIIIQDLSFGEGKCDVSKINVKIMKLNK